LEIKLAIFYTLGGSCKTCSRRLGAATQEGNPTTLAKIPHEHVNKKLLGCAPTGYLQIKARCRSTQPTRVFSPVSPPCAAFDSRSPVWMPVGCRGEAS